MGADFICIQCGALKERLIGPELRPGETHYIPCLKCGEIGMRDAVDLSAPRQLTGPPAKRRK